MDYKHQICEFLTWTNVFNVHLVLSEIYEKNNTVNKNFHFSQNESKIITSVNFPAQELAYNSVLYTKKTKLRATL
jgi:hypothetical protein